ncbi:phage integrase N-terminal SAM-like domain-containing protein [Oceanobacillus alkalisoli]|uniref:phage integrase N-terminal SAM-like domain-containing protein n=1 Tax=Oceanobacillus alkalisoli TaxID=2925113 RepID=UPI001F11C09D|nr:site-specific integrase [Oceanobacillus alkalisoli]MCF3942180.1 hypothetical protein [Oceanobacillus alkalisoli]
MNPNVVLAGWLNRYETNTKQTYKRCVDQFFSIAKKQSVEELSEKDIFNYLEEIEHDNANSKHTKVEALRSYLLFCKETGISKMDFTPLLARVERQTKEKTYMELDDFKKLYKKIQKASNDDHRVLKALYFDQRKVSDIAHEMKILRPEINNMLYRYHPTATPTMIKNSLDAHKKELATNHLER